MHTYMYNICTLSRVQTNLRVLIFRKKMFVCFLWYLIYSKGNLCIFFSFLITCMAAYRTLSDKLSPCNCTERLTLPVAYNVRTWNVSYMYLQWLQTKVGRTAPKSKLSVVQRVLHWNYLSSVVINLLLIQIFLMAYGKIDNLKTEAIWI